MKFDHIAFCKNLREFRERKGYNKYEMSIQADIHYSYYLAIESGKAIPNFRGLISIANALNTDISHLLGKKPLHKKDIIKKEILSKLQNVKNDELLDSLYSILISIRLWSDGEPENERL